MAKAHSPLRLEANLVKQASIAGKQLHRSTAEQIEYWADLGRSISKVITPDTLLQVYAGLAQVKVEPVVAPTIDPENLFESIEEEREKGYLHKNLTKSQKRYQASTLHPGFLEQIDSNGTVTVGQFKNGEFHPLQDPRIE